MKRIKKSKQNNDERLEFLSLRMIEADLLYQINFKDLEKHTQCSLLQLPFSV
jgi:hypothetical protein